MAKILILIEDGEGDQAGKTLVKISGDFENRAERILSGEITNAQSAAIVMCVPIQQEQAECEEVYGVGSGDCVEFYCADMDESVKNPILNFEKV